MTECIIDHMSLSVADFAAMVEFYEKALAPLGVTVLMRLGKNVTGNVELAGLGREKPFLWIADGGKTAPHVHLAIRADTRAAVDAFHQAAMAADGKDNGAPGLRPHYHANYYGAFIIDPEGHNLEAVCHKGDQ
jgi:catechol 2,3-dioxygenase-like lactoylglutathione lyase family enzyme